MMTVPYLGQTLLAVLACACSLLSLGFSVAFGTNVARFRDSSGAEQLLWTVVFSFPAAAVLTGCIGAYAGMRVVFVVIVAAMIFTAFTAVPVIVRPRNNLRSMRAETKAALAIVGSVAVWIILANLPILTHTGLYETTTSADWSVRVPQLAAVVRGGIPPLNPLGAAGGQMELRYYYYWFAVFGVMGKLTHLAPRALMIAGCVWSALCLYASLMLALKYIFLPEQHRYTQNLRKLALWSLGLSFVLGPDILIAAIAALKYKVLYQDIEWWRQSLASSPSFITCFTYSPHIATGVATAFLSILLLTLPLLKPAHSADEGREAVITRGVLAGISLGAAVGSATFVAMCLSTMWVCLFFWRLYRRDFKTVSAMAIGGLVSVVCAGPFLHIMISQPVSETGQLPRFTLRGFPFSGWIMGTYPPLLGLHLSLTGKRVIRLLLYALLELSEPSFFLFVLLAKLRELRREQKTLSDRDVVQWITFGCFLFFALFVTSEGKIGSNDLGLHAAVGLRSISVLWGAYLCWDLWHDTAKRTRFLRSPAGWLALVLLVLGLSTQAWQLIMERMFVPVMSSGRFKPTDLYPNPVRMPSDALDAFRAAQWIQSESPRRVLTDPYAVPGGKDMYYSNYTLVAASPDCYAVYGTHPKACADAMPVFAELYRVQDDDMPVESVPKSASADVFERACRVGEADLVLITHDDPVWDEADSWMSHAQPVYANATRRVYRCPQAN